MSLNEWIVFAVVCAVIGAAVGGLKGGTAPLTGFLGGLFLGPLGILLISLSPKQGLKCNACKGIVPKGAALCMHCRSDLRAVGIHNG